MSTITVKNIPPVLYNQLKTSAQLHRRSINSEIIICLEKVLSSQKHPTQEVLSRARKLREKTSEALITDDEFTYAKREGRP
jgi:plasmid stability protein